MMNSFLKMALLSTALMAPPVAQAQEVVTWWDFLGGGDGVRMKALIEKFNAENAGKIEIQATTLEWGTPFYTKVQTSAAIGEGPDVMTYHLSRLPLGVSSGTLSEITDRRDGRAGISGCRLHRVQLEAAQVDGKQYAVPFDIHSG
jgi:multiple sugar transport system substrate-binding protein